MWELAQQPSFYVQFALEMEGAEAWARDELKKRQPAGFKVTL